MNQEIKLSPVEFKIFSENQLIIQQAQLNLKIANEKLNNVLSLICESRQIDQYDNLEFNMDNQTLIFIHNEKNNEQLPVVPVENVKYGRIRKKK